MDEGSTIIKDGIVKSSVQNLEIPDVEFATFLRSTCSRYKENTALVFGDESYSFAKLEEECWKVATGLRSKYGFGPGHVAAFMADNSIDLVFALLGTVFSGGALSFLKTNLTEGEICQLLQISQPSILFCDLKNAEKVKRAFADLTCVKVLFCFGECEAMVSFSSLKRITHSPPSPEVPEVLEKAEGHLLAILYTSGSTGAPKGVPLSHKNFISSLVCFQQGNRAVNECQTFLAYTPMMHFGGGFWTFCVMLSKGAKTVLLKEYDLDVALTASLGHKDIIMAVYPTYVSLLLESRFIKEIDVKSFRAVITAGSTTSGNLLQLLADKFKYSTILHGYGMTETCCLVTFPRSSTKDVKSVGSPIAMTEIKIVDMKTGRTVGPGEYGEVCVRGPTCFKEYHGKSATTRGVFDDCGFLKTGDTGCYTELGEIYVQGRIKDLFKCQEQLVAPAELEELLLKHPDVCEAVVAGVPHARLGEAARAFVVLRQGVRQDSAMDQALQEFVKGSVPFYKELHGGVQFLQKIPMDETGKSLRRALVDAYKRVC